jgi:hypothetical protein
MKANPSTNSEARPLVGLENSFGFWCALDAFLEAPGDSGSAQALASAFGSGQLDLKPLLNAYVESGKILEQYQQVLATRAKQSGGEGYRKILGIDSNEVEARPAFTELWHVVVSLYLARTLTKQVSQVDFYRFLTRMFVFTLGWYANAIWTRPEHVFEVFNRSARQMESGEIIHVKPPKLLLFFQHPRSFASGSAQIVVGPYRHTQEGQLEALSVLPEHDYLTSPQLVAAEQLPVEYEEAGQMRVSVAYPSEPLSKSGGRCYLIPFAEQMNLEQVAHNKALQLEWEAYIEAIDALRPNSLPISDATQQRDALLKRFARTLSTHYPDVSDHAKCVAAGSLAVLLGLLDTEAEHDNHPTRRVSYTSYLRQSVRNAVRSKAKL